MLEATRDIPSEDVRANLTRVSPDHALAHRFPDCFREATDGPGDQIRWSTPTVKAECTVAGGSQPRQSTRPQPRRPRLPLADEDRRRKELLAEFDAPVESEHSRRRRVHWEGAQRLLDSLKSPAERDREWREMREDAEHAEVTQALAQLARAQFEEIDRAWNWN